MANCKNCGTELPATKDHALHERLFCDNNNRCKMAYRRKQSRQDKQGTALSNEALQLAYSKIERQEQEINALKWQLEEAQKKIAELESARPPLAKQKKTRELLPDGWVDMNEFTGKHKIPSREINRLIKEAHIHPIKGQWETSNGFKSNIALSLYGQREVWVQCSNNPNVPQFNECTDCPHTL